MKQIKKILTEIKHVNDQQILYNKYQSEQYFQVWVSLFLDFSKITYHYLFWVCYNHVFIMLNTYKAVKNIFESFHLNIFYCNT